MLGSKVSVLFGWIIWGIGLGLLIIGVLAKAYNFADRIVDEEDEGALCLDSDNEGVESRSDYI